MYVKQTFCTCHQVAVLNCHTSKQTLSELIAERLLLRSGYMPCTCPDGPEPLIRHTLIGAPHDVVKGRFSTCLGAKLLLGSHRRSVLRSQREQ